MEGGREEKQVPLEGKAIGGGKEEEGREAGVCVYVCVCVSSRCGCRSKLFIDGRSGDVVREGKVKEGWEVAGGGGGREMRMFVWLELKKTTKFKHSPSRNIFLPSADGFSSFRLSLSLFFPPFPLFFPHPSLKTSGNIYN